jgi:tetratricopeptide (TPR) repeat protein
MQGAPTSTPETLSAGRDLEVLYQYNYLFYDDMITGHSMYARADVGLHREEICARRLSRFLTASPNELYNKALTLYSQRRYWDAFFVFGQILTEYPDFFKNDWVTYYYANCFEALDLRKTSMEEYQNATIKYYGSDMVANAELGIMRIAYRNEDETLVKTQFEKLVPTGTNDSLRCHAFYLMGESLLRQGEDSRAITMLAVIPESHPAYVFAQHSIGVAYARLSNPPLSEAAFARAIAVTPKTAVESNAISLSLLHAGYLFYEQGSLSKAVTTLRKVDATSPHYAEALRALGWCGVKARQWGDCLRAGESLSKIAQTPLLLCEAALLKGYALLMQKEYGSAVQTAKSAIRIAEEASAPSQDTMALRTNAYESQRITYETCGQSASEAVLGKTVESARRFVDSLHVEQLRLRSDINNYAAFKDDFKHATILSATLESVREDLSYLLATAGKMKQGNALLRHEKGAQNTEKIDKAIEKVRRELNEMNRAKDSVP